VQRTPDVRLVRRSVESMRAAIQPEILAALEQAARDPERWKVAATDPRDFLHDLGFDLPQNVELVLSSETREAVLLRQLSWSYSENQGMKTHVLVTVEVPSWEG
jgi:hypothetical protein